MRVAGAAHGRSAHDRAGHRGTALAECAGVIARYWITVGIPYVILFLCISFTKRTHKITSIRFFSPPSLLPLSAETCQQKAASEAHKTALRLFNDRLHIILSLIKMISISCKTSTPKEPLKEPPRSAELTFGADVRGRENGRRRLYRKHLLGDFCAGISRFRSLSLQSK